MTLKACCLDCRREVDVLVLEGEGRTYYYHPYFGGLSGYLYGFHFLAVAGVA